MGRAGGEPEVEGDEVPRDRTHQPGEDHADGEHVLHHHVVGDRAGHVGAEEEEGDEVERRGPQHRQAR